MPITITKESSQYQGQSDILTGRWYTDFRNNLNNKHVSSETEFKSTLHARKPQWINGSRVDYIVPTPYIISVTEANGNARDPEPLKNAIIAIRLDLNKTASGSNVIIREKYTGREVTKTVTNDGLVYLKFTDIDINTNRKVIRKWQQESPGASWCSTRGNDKETCYRETIIYDVVEYEVERIFLARQVSGSNWSNEGYYKYHNTDYKYIRSYTYEWER